ncbi:type IV secretory system conjugative DNA transfer family protein [Hyphomicrobium sp. 2TAF46]|uniref:type IV secretory system conjugative DNA transfer family protein n=1 Tax=Hyphomicrobium sp. 2TAF46 TaxID=3233019 RepID=UPI003F9010C2
MTALTLLVLYPQAYPPYVSPPDIYPAALFGLLVLGPTVGILLTFADVVPRRVAGLTGLLFTALLWALVAARFGPFIAPPAPDRRFFLRLADVDPVLYAGGTTAIVLIALLLKRAVAGTLDFHGIAEGSFGDATWMSLEDVSQLLPPDGEVVIGECSRPDLDRAIAGLAFDPNDRSTWGEGGRALLATFKLNFESTHMLMFAGSGGFKTTSSVVPTALKYSGSMVVLDPAGEVAPLVQAVRARVSPRRRIVVLDPTAPLETIQGFNVLAPLLHSPNQAADAVAFAKLLCGEGSGKEGGAAEYFQAQAHNLMTGLLLTVLTSEAYETDRTLRALRSLTSLSETDLKARLKDIVSESPIRLVRETLAPFVGMADQTFTGIASTVAKDTQWLSLEPYAALVAGSTFEAADLPRGKLDVFIQVPGEILKSYPAVGRVIIGSLMRAMVQANGRHAKRVLFCLDEADLLGRMNILEEARDRGRKYGITLMLLYQSVGQLENHFGKEGATSWFEGVSLVSYAAVKSMETAKHLSERCGDTTIRVKNQSHGTSMLFGPLSPTAAGKGTQSFSLQKRPLILPHEIVQGLRADEQIVLIRGYPPIRMGRAIYFRRPEMLATAGTVKFK